MTGLILAGGENRRLPFNKCLMEIDGLPAIERIADVYRRHLSDIVISTNQPEHVFKYGAVLVGDVLDERGPMTGIFSAMVCIQSDAFLVIGCDMPFLNEELIKYMLSLTRDESAIVPVYQGEPQPLFAIYKRRLIDRLYAKITKRKKGMKRFLREIDTFFIDEQIVRTYDPDGLSFVNINTLEDVRKIKGGV